MEFALTESGRSKPIKTGDRAKCPGCGGVVMSAVGHIMRPHWKHVVKDCDPWYEPTTEWHLGWQEKVKDEHREIVIRDENSNKVHRADVVRPPQYYLESPDSIRVPLTVVEFQHSSISVDEILDRESFYTEDSIRRMTWVFDCIDAADRMEYRFLGRANSLLGYGYYEQLHPMPKSWTPVTRADGDEHMEFCGNLYQFKWSHPKKHIFHTQVGLILDIGTSALIRVDFLGKYGEFFGTFISRALFVDWLRGSDLCLMRDWRERS